jgi:glycosyltransferase involved in cell wall biosynthesis
VTKIIQVPFCFYPDPVGGTEVYVASLSRHLQAADMQVVVAAPDEQDREYTYEGLLVKRFALGEITGPRDLYSSGDVRAAQAFGRILDDERPTLVHLHGITRGVSLRLVREAKRRNIPVVFTYHIGTVSCARGSLLRWGTENCDGQLDLNRCTQCTLHGLGLPRNLAGMVSRVPVIAGRGIGLLPNMGKVTTAMRMRELVDLRHASFRALMAEVDHIVAVNNWVAEILRRNNVPAEKITVSRYGFSQTLDELSSINPPSDDEPLRVAYLGRVETAKGPDLLVEAIRNMPGASIELHLYGIAQGMEGQAYLQRLKLLAGSDSRIVFNHAVPTDQIVKLLSSFHILAIPSRVRETGPIVALEAFAAGVPVIGSNLGGIAELINHEVNGLLVEVNSVASWKQTFKRILEDWDLLAHLRMGISSPRNMGMASTEIMKIYDTLLSRTGS